MKKYLLVLIVVFMMLAPGVKAETYNFDYSDSPESYCDFYYNDLSKYSEIINQLYNSVYDYYFKKFYNDFPYFHIDLIALDSSNCNSSRKGIASIKLYLNAFSTIPTYSNYTHASKVIEVSYVFSTTTYILPSEIDGYYFPRIFDDNSMNYFPNAYYISNYDLINDTSNTYNVSSLNISYSPGDVIAPVHTLDSLLSNFTTVNLNDYAYIALFLKDYSKTKAFSTTTYVKGQSCITPLYNFSTSLKPDKSENICSPVYSDYTASDIYVLKSDIENKAVYYVSKYDSSIENSIKIDTSVFDIFYVKEEDAANPTFNYKGHEYAGIGLDNVDYSANKNTENGLVPGESKNVADTFADVIKKPLELFKNISSGLTSFFSLITSFLGFLPTELQGFLYFSFVVAIVLGIIKIIL